MIIPNHLSCGSKGRGILDPPLPPGGGGHVSLGPVHHPRQSLSEKDPKRGWSDRTHSSLNTTPRVRTGVSPRKCPTLSADRPRTCPGGGTRSVNLIPFFHVFLFSIPLTRYARYAPGGEIDTLFTRLYWRGWCTGPDETCPPPPPPGLCLVPASVYIYFSPLILPEESWFRVCSNEFVTANHNVLAAPIPLLILGHVDYLRCVLKWKRTSWKLSYRYSVLGSRPELRRSRPGTETLCTYTMYIGQDQNQDQDK